MLQSGFIYVQAYDYNGCWTNQDSVYLNVIKEEYQLTSDTLKACAGAIVEISVSTIMDSVVWFTPLGFETSKEFNVISSNNSAGIYEVNLWDSLGCSYIDTILLVNNPIPSSTMSDQVIICTGGYLKKPENTESLIYEWKEVPNEDSIAVYTVSFMNYYVVNEFGCYHKDSIEFILTQCSGKVPNVFTPNGDGVNDVLYIHDALLYPNNTLILLNRWGQIVFKEHGYKNTFSGEDLKEHVYFYLYYRLGEAYPETMEQGFIHLVR
jgi:gliding motility-associated-like protein